MARISYFQGLLLLVAIIPGTALLGRQSGPKSPAVSSWNAYCRSVDTQTGAWSKCPMDDIVSVSPLQTMSDFDRRGATQNASTRLLAQECLDAVGRGTWMKSVAKHRMDSLGSNSRYAGPKYYYGPRSLLADEPLAVRVHPHARRYKYKQQMQGSPEFVWQPIDEISSCPKYKWLDQTKVSDCLNQTWIAFWGDSTTRIAFSALVDFLGDGIESSDFPTHDFTYREHTAHDHCQANNRCHLVVHFPHRGIILTFNFAWTLRSYPNLQETFGAYANKELFPDIPLQRSQPDIILMNNGPWEWESGPISSGWPGDAAYVSQLTAFLKQYWGNQTVNAPKLIVLRNTACTIPDDPFSNMMHMHPLQKQVLRDFAQHAGNAQIRYLDGEYVHNVPEAYDCAGQTLYHLPSIITDQRINHAVYALCG